MKGKYHWAIGHLLLLHTSAEFGDSEMKIEKKNSREYIRTHMDVGYTRTRGIQGQVRKSQVVHHRWIIQSNGLLFTYNKSNKKKKALLSKFRNMTAYRIYHSPARKKTIINLKSELCWWNNDRQLSLYHFRTTT
jgi:Fic family protein